MFGVFVLFDLHLYFESWTLQLPKSFAPHYFSSDYVESIKWDVPARPLLHYSVRCHEYGDRSGHCNRDSLKLSTMVWNWRSLWCRPPKCREFSGRSDGFEGGLWNVPNGRSPPPPPQSPHCHHHRHRRPPPPPPSPPFWSVAVLCWQGNALADCPYFFCQTLAIVLSRRQHHISQSSSRSSLRSLYAVIEAWSDELCDQSRLHQEIVESEQSSRDLMRLLMGQKKNRICQAQRQLELEHESRMAIISKTDAANLHRMQKFRMETVVTLLGRDQLIAESNHPACYFPVIPDYFPMHGSGSTKIFWCKKIDKNACLY